MCRPITCKKCGRPSWAGCGAHVEQVLRNVPKSQRCQCREQAVPKSGAGFLSRLLGRERAGTA